MDTHIVIIIVIMIIIIIIIIIIITVLSTPQNLLVGHAAKKEKIVLFDKIVHEKIFANNFVYHQILKKTFL